ncbi:junctional adhesion molecule 3B-like isoform X2 [Vanacampus margaritifer]
MRTYVLCAASLCIICAFMCHIPSSLAVILQTTDKIVWASVSESVDLTCQFESTSTNNPRIEWKKIKNGITSFVYFEKKIVGALKNRARLIKPATFVLLNVTREDAAEYRCEVTAVDDEKKYDEIMILLEVRVKPAVPQCSVPQSVAFGTTVELKCLVNDSNPAPVYRWFRNDKEVPQYPERSDGVYTINASTGILKVCGVRMEDEGEYYCLAENNAGYTQCPSQLMNVHTTPVDNLSIMMYILLGTCCVSAPVSLFAVKIVFYSVGQNGMKVLTTRAVQMRN